MKNTVLPKTHPELLSLNNCFNKLNLHRQLVANHIKELFDSNTLPKEIDSEIRKKGFSEPEITQIINGNRPVEKVQNLITLLGHILSYDFKTAEFHKEYDVELLDALTRKKLTQLDSFIAKSFAGYYFGYSKDNSKPFPFLFYINTNGSVQMVGRDDYYREGVMSVIDWKLYFFLDSATKKEPEFYVTSIPTKFKSDIRYVKEVKLCGIWIDRKGRPSYGDCLLINQSLKSDRRKLKHAFLNDIQEMITHSIKSNKSLKGISDVVFDKIEQLENYNEIIERVKVDMVGKKTLSLNSSITWE